MRSALLAAAFLSTGIAAQSVPMQGFMHNWDRPTLGGGITIYIRGAAAAEEVLNRIDTDDHIDWALDANGDVGLGGLLLWMLDANDSTVEVFNVVAYPEDPLTADFPDLTNQVMSIPIQMPPTSNPPGQIAWRLGFELTQPVAVPAGGDVFVGVGLPAMISGTQPFDGLFVGTINNDATTPTPFPFDVPGPRGQPGGGIGQDSYVSFNANSTVTYPASAPGSLMQLGIDVMTDGGMVGGVALATTNQASYPLSAAPQGTSNFLSGLHPDIARGDDIGFAVTANTSQVAAGSLCVIMMALGPSPIGSTPIGTLSTAANSPDSAGNVYIDFTNPATFLTFLSPGVTPSALPNMLEGQFVVPLSPQARAIVAGLAGPFDLWWQGFVLDLSAGGPPFEVRTTGCVVQKLK